MSNWIEWSGGKMPVPFNALVAVRFRDGTENDIIAYRVVTP